MSPRRAIVLPDRADRSPRSAFGTDPARRLRDVVVAHAGVRAGSRAGNSPRQCSAGLAPSCEVSAVSEPNSSADRCKGKADRLQVTRQQKQRVQNASESRQPNRGQRQPVTASGRCRSDDWAGLMTAPIWAGRLGNSPSTLPCSASTAESVRLA